AHVLAVCAQCADRVEIDDLAPPGCSAVVGVDLEVPEAVVDVGVADEEVEPDPRAALAEDVIDSGDFLHAVDVAPDDVAGDARLDHVAVLDPVLRTGELGQGREVANLPVPPHDLRVAVLGLEAPEEYLVPRAPVRGDRAAQPYLDLLEVLIGRVPAEYRRSRVLVPAPPAGQHGRGVVVVSLRAGRPARHGVQVSLFGASFSDGHPGHRPVDLTVAGDDVGPVDPVGAAVEPDPAFGDRVFA